MPNRPARFLSRPSQNMVVKNYRPRSLSERFADVFTSFFGTSAFFFFNVFLFAGWIFFNGGVISGISPFDPYPFNLLTTAVSLEAIFLSIIVLMSQNRAARIADVRDEVDFQVNVQAEREVKKTLEILTKIEKRLHMTQKADPELLEMLRKIDVDELERRVMRAIERASK